MRGRTFGLLVVLAAATVLTFALAGCGAPSEMTVGPADDGKTVEVAQGGVVTVELESNPTTGYDWYLQGSLPSQLTTSADDYAPAAAPGVVGGGGTRTIKYKATGAGSATVTLVYVRPWETGVAPAKTFTVTVNVK